MSTEQNLQKEIEALDKEAREAMDKLADKREELQRQLKATELAEERQREREELKRRKATEEAQRRRVEEAKSRCEELHREAAGLSEERDALAARLKEIFAEQSELAMQMQQAVYVYDPERANQIATDSVGAHQTWLADTFASLR
jgi:chromosome segregation ATPase